MKKFITPVLPVLFLCMAVLAGCSSSVPKEQGSSYAPYFTSPAVNSLGEANTLYKTPVPAGDNETLRVVLLSGYTYLEQALNHYGYLSVVVMFTDSNEKYKFVVERAVFDQFTNNEIDVTTFVSRIRKEVSNDY